MKERVFYRVGFGWGCKLAGTEHGPYQTAEQAAHEARQHQFTLREIERDRETTAASHEHWPYEIKST